MSVVGIGTDLVSIGRISKLLDRHGKRFVDRCFRSGDLSAEAPYREEALSSDPILLAGRWAAKEAFLKALGTDVGGIPYRDMEVKKTSGGSVELVLHDRAHRALVEAGGNRIHLTISHEREFAVASVLIEG